MTHEFLPELLQRHAERYPQVGVEVRTIHQDQMTPALLTRSVEFALGFFKHPHPQIASELLVSGQFYLAVAAPLWQRAPRTATIAARLARLPLIRLVGDDPMRQSIDDLALRIGTPEGPGLQVQTSRLALELVRRGMGWTVVDFLTARQQDPAAIATEPLRELPPLSLYSYHARPSPPGLQATRMLDMLPQVLHSVLAAR